VGIASEMLSRVFDMFARVESAAAASQGGLGIGLALSRRLVELHGGELVAQSAGPGQGSRFAWRLPRVAAPVQARVAAPPAAPAVAPSPAPGPAPARSRRILVVDDNVDAAESLAAMLDLDGHRVRAVFDGPSALALAEEMQPEIALLDVGMPGMDGHELARRLGARPWAHGLVLVAVTGWGQEGDRRRSAEAGFHHHLVKPVDPADLDAIIRAA